MQTTRGERTHRLLPYLARMNYDQGYILCACRVLCLTCSCSAAFDAPHRLQPTDTSVDTQLCSMTWMIGLWCAHLARAYKCPASFCHAHSISRSSGLADLLLIRCQLCIGATISLLRKRTGETCCVRQ